LTEFERFDLGSSDIDGYEGKNGVNPDVDDEEEALEADHGSIQNVADSWCSTGECKD
jgi:hypothetical protein